jgi:hypothetical protein
MFRKKSMFHKCINKNISKATFNVKHRFCVISMRAQLNDFYGGVSVAVCCRHGVRKCFQLRNIFSKTFYQHNKRFSHHEGIFKVFLPFFCVHVQLIPACDKELKLPHVRSLFLINVTCNAVQCLKSHLFRNSFRCK